MSTYYSNGDTEVQVYLECRYKGYQVSTAPSTAEQDQVSTGVGLQGILINSSLVMSKQYRVEIHAATRSYATSDTQAACTAVYNTYSSVSHIQPRDACSCQLRCIDGDRSLYFTRVYTCAGHLLQDTGMPTQAAVLTWGNSLFYSVHFSYYFAMTSI